MLACLYSFNYVTNYDWAVTRSAKKEEGHSQGAHSLQWREGFLEINWLGSYGFASPGVSFFSLPMGLSRWPSGKDPSVNSRDTKYMGSISGSWRTSEEEMATLSSSFAWEISWTEDPGGLSSIGLQSVGHNWTAGVI